MFYTFQDLLFSSSVAIYVAVSITIAAVRWGHKCEPYARHMDYYYPAWKVMVHCFLMTVLLVPAIFKPHDSDALVQVRITLIMTSFFNSSVIMFAYFGKILNVTRWRLPVYILTVPFTLMIISASFFTIYPGTQMQGGYYPVYFGTCGILAVLFLISLALAVRMVARAILKVSQENYSNPEDFPRRYAMRILWIPVAHLAVSWISAGIGTQQSVSVGLIVLSAINVAFLIGALSPHRAKDITRFEKEAEAVEAMPMEPAENNPHNEELVRAIKHCIEDEKAYLDSHLTLASLSRSCGVNRTYVSQVMSEHMGGFFSYINRCRMEYAERFRLDYPNASVEEVAMASGFGSRQSYYNVRRQLSKEKDR